MIWIFIVDLWRNLGRAWGNFWRRLLRRRAGYVTIKISGGLPQHSPALSWWQRRVPGYPEPDLSLETLGRMLERVAADPHALGVVLRLRGLNANLARLQSLRRLIERFRRSGKRVLVYAPSATTGVYYVASAADRLVMPESGNLFIWGLGLESVFVKETLAMLGIQVEVEAVSPFKTAGDTFSRAQASPEHRQMFDWLLDSWFEQIVAGIAQGRGLEPDRVRALIDEGLFRPERALAAGLIDAVAYEDQLPELLGEPEGPARLQTWASAQAALWRPYRRRSRQVVAVVSLEGMIVSGPSRRLPVPLPLPLLGDRFAGSQTIIQALRRAEREERVAAVLFYVDSRGGSALASDLIARELARLRRRKPVVVYMGDVAASGGYYVSAPASWIVAQPATRTGSIGVVSLKPVTRGLLDKAEANRLILQRGKRATMFSDAAPFSPDERAAVRHMMDAGYQQFKGQVARGRAIRAEALERVAGGRVWTGQQALEHGLVDQLGDFETALTKAKSLAGLPEEREVPLLWLGAGKGGLLPLAWREGQTPFDPLALLRSLLGERVLAWEPFELRLWV